MNAQVRAGCYLRISSDPQDKREGVDRQRDDTADMCTINGWTVAGVYTDNDRSASSGADRPAWKRLLGDITEGKIDAVVVWNQDRGWRKMAELESLRPVFEPRGVRLATTNIGTIDFRNADDVFRAQVSTALSEMEVAKMRVRQLRAARQNAERGVPKWRNAFGFKTDGSRQPDPRTAPMVKQVYAHILAGGSISDGARMLNDAGAYGLNGKPWTPTTVSLFLRAARNAGLRSHTYQDTTTGKPVTEIVGQGNWPALVDETMWRAAQSILKAPGRVRGTRTVRNHLLTAVLLCGNPGCGGHLSGQWIYRHTGGAPGRPKAGETKQAGGHVARVLTYQCKRCHGVAVRAAHVEPMILELASRRLAMGDAADLLKAELHDAQQAEVVRDELQTLYGELDSLAVERAEGLLTARQVQIATEVINGKIATLERSQQDQERLRVFDGIPLGTPEVGKAIAGLSADRYRAVLGVLGTITVAPVGKGGTAFNPDRVSVDWR